MSGKPSIIVTVLAIAVVSAATAGAGVLRGDVALNAVSKKSREDTVVWISALPDAVEKKLVQGGFRWPWQAKRVLPVPRLSESQRQFAPRVSVVVVHSALALRNQDDVWHGAFSVSPGGAFDLGKRAPGAVDTLRFERTGQFTVRCDIHPEMTGYVVVLPNHAYARVDSAGTWRLPELPKGRYELRAWHPERGETRVSVQVPAHGDSLVRLHW